MSLTTPDDVIRYVQQELTTGGASRDQLLRRAFDNNAPMTIIRTLHGLPSRHFFSVADLRRQLPESR